MPWSLASLLSAPLSLASAVLPNIPSAALPANLQQRLVAFLLRRTLGRFLKGGLDDDRVQADVRAGRFVLDSVQVDEQAINSLLSPTSSAAATDDGPIPPLPLPVRFESGTIGSITALVAWPLAKLDLAVQDVELTFRIAPACSIPPSSDIDSPSPLPSPTTRPQPHRRASDVVQLDEDAALSVSIAHSFVSHELRPDEDAELRASLHLSPSASSASFELPGAFGGARRDPSAADTNEREAEQVETTVMARWVERVLARLVVRVARLRVRLVWDAQDGEQGVHEAELRIDDMLCRGDAGEGAGTRSLELTPPRVYLRTAAKPPSTPRATDMFTPDCGAVSSEDESDGSADENDLLAMSQSIADLRTSVHLTASSSAREMFHSFASGPAPVQEEEEEEDDPFQNPDGEGDNDVFATPQSSPLRQDSTPLPTTSISDSDGWELVVSLGPPTATSGGSQPRLTFLLATSVPTQAYLDMAPILRATTTLQANLAHPWTIAVHPAHFYALGALSAQLAPSPSPAISRSAPRSSTTSTAPVSTAPAVRLDLALRAANLVVFLPQTDASSRAALQTMWASGPDPFAAPPAAFKASHVRLRLETLAFASRSSSGAGPGLDLTLGHLSLLETNQYLGSWRTLPLLVDDAGLARPTADASGLPSVDWLQTDQNLYGKDWRVSIPSRRRRATTTSAIKEGTSSKPEPAALVCLRDGSTEIQLAPMHVFADLSAVGRLGPLCDTLSDVIMTFRPPTASAQVPVQPPQRNTILDDLARAPSSQTSRPTPTTISLPLLRLDVRVPAPRRHRVAIGDPLALRGGRITLDARDLRANLTGVGGASMTTVDVGSLTGRFSPPLAASPGESEFLRIGPLADEPDATRPACAFRTDASLPHDRGPEVELTLPLVHLTLDKPAWDGLQLIADDAGQYLDELRRAAGRAEGLDEEEGEEEGREKMIGSRYFGAGMGRESETESTASGATVRDDHGQTDVRPGGTTLGLRALVTDVIIDLRIDPLPPTPANTERHLRLSASDIDVRVDILENGKDSLRAAISVMDAKFEDVTKQTIVVQPVVVFSRTMPRSLTANRAPLVDLAFTSSGEKESSLKESKVQLTLANVTYFVTSDIVWLEELRRFAASPAGAFEHVVPNELTRLRIRLSSVSLHVSAHSRQSHVVLSIADARLRTDLMPDLPRTTLTAEVTGAKLGMVDSDADVIHSAASRGREENAWDHWKRRGFAQILHLRSASVTARQGNGLVLPDLEVLIDGARVEVSLCADTVSSMQAFLADIASAPAFQAKQQTVAPPTVARRLPTRARSGDLLASVDPAAFEHAISVNDLPEILNDDVPANLDYLADALSQKSVRARGRRESIGPLAKQEGELLSDVDGETIRMFSPQGLQIVDDWLAESQIDDTDYSLPASKIRCRLTNAEVVVYLHEGYDWASTRRAIEEEAKAVRRRLEKIRQLLSTGQQADASAERASVLMFGSLQLGLPPGASDLPPTELLAAIDEELNNDARSDVVSTAVSSWQTFPAGTSAAHRKAAPAVVGKARRRLTRSKAFAIGINLHGLSASFDAYPSSPTSLAASLSAGAMEQLASKIQLEVFNFEIVDNVKTSTWRKFLTELRPNDGGVVRPTGAPMAKIDMSTVKPASRSDDGQDEILLKIKVSPLRLYVDQDALDFLKAFGAFELPATRKTPGAAPSGSAAREPFYQRVEVLPVKLKLDYKPKRVDYNALRNGKTAELMNFFHFDGSEMTLRHLVVTGISGTTTLSSLVQDIWTPDVKAHQLADVISGIAPVRSVVNVGAGVANLVLLPIEQYRKDGRVVRGLQKGASAFARQTTLEAINVGAKLATGTQVILEQAEHVLGARFAAPLAVETVAVSSSTAVAADSASQEAEDSLLDEERQEVRSRYASQPADLRQGMQSAYKSLGENFKEAAQTILAVPMEVYERSGTEGPVRSVVRAVPVAVLKPMIGASSAMSKALLGLRNSLDPDAQAGELEDKYKPTTGYSTGGSV